MKTIVTVSICLAALSAAARPWPDSSTQIVAFADQIPGSLNSTQRWFAATKLAGTQKQLRSEIQAIRAYNTNFLCLHYQLAVGCGPELFIDGNDWTSDWSAVSSHANWFLLNERTQRVHQTHWNWDVMDVTYSNGAANSAFPQYWITSCLARIRSAEDDAVFADSFTVDSYGFGQCDPTHALLEDVDACSTGWVPNLERFGAAVTNAFAGDGGGFLFLPNLGGLITGWDPMNYGVGHGGMIEGFCYWDSWNGFDESDWVLQMNRALSLVRSNKIIICQSTPATWDTTNRMFATAAYLLIKGARTYLNLLTTGDIALEYYPEYTIRLGGAASNVSSTVSNMWYAPWRVYRRGYANGIVLVNPGSASRSIASLGTNYLLVGASGGGYVDENGSYDGSLSYLSVTSLTLAPYSGAVLLYTTNSAATNSPLQASGLSALHRSGQTFLTWNELPGVTGELYRVYRHTSPIAASNLHQAGFLYAVPERSVRFYASRYNVDGGGTWQSRYRDRYVITDNGAQLPVGTGLLVWTLATNEFSGGARTGSAYYAVTVVSPGGGENTGDFGAANSIGPVAEGISDPLPVEITNYPPVSGGGRVHIFIQYMDLRNWNPTFHAPHARNDYYGFPLSDPYVTNALQYAYDYAVVEPACSTSLAPLVMSLHGWAGNTYGPVTSDPDPYNWCAYKVYPVDVSETWYFGFARNCDYRRGDEPSAGDEVVNFTEQRVLRMVYDTARHPPGAAAVDTNRLFVYGHSMGGSGTFSLALRYPNVFAAANASQPMTDYSRSGDGGGTDWRGDVGWKWGAVALDLPVQIDGPAGWADPLKKYNGTGVWTWQNHQGNLITRAAEEIVPVGIGHGTNDDTIEWPTQGRDAYPALNRSRQCWGAQVTEAGHSWMGFELMPPALGPDASLTPFRGFSVVRNETVPGLGNCTEDNALPPSQPGDFNHALEWSASWYGWDGAPTDTTNRWQMSFRSLSGSSLSVDVTPRRLRQFPKAAGTRVLWRNFPIGSSTAVQIGQLAADGDGLITITNFLVSTGGNRLRIDRDSVVDYDSDGMPDYWERAFGLNPSNAADAALDGDNDGARNMDEYRAGTHPSNSVSVFRITDFTANRIAWQSAQGFGYRLATPESVSNWGEQGSVITAATEASAFLLPENTNSHGFYRLATPP